MPEVGLFDDIVAAPAADAKGLFDDIVQSAPPTKDLFSDILSAPMFYQSEAEAKAAGHDKPFQGTALDKQYFLPPPKVWYPNKEAFDDAFKSRLEAGTQNIEAVEGPMLKLRYQKPKGVVQGLANVPLGVGEFLTSPLGVTAALSGPIAGPRAAAATAGYFFGDIALHVPEQIKGTVQAIKTGEAGPIAESVGGLAATPFFLRSLYRGAARPFRPIEPVEPISPTERAVSPLELKAEQSSLTAGVEPMPIELVDLTDRKVYGPGGEAGQVTSDMVGIVEVNTGKEVKTWRKAELDQERLFSDYPELSQPSRGPTTSVETERPPDIIDAIGDTYGNERVLNAAEIHKLDPNFPKNGFELNRSGWPKWFKKLFYYPKEGEPKRGHPQDVLNALQREGRFTNVEDTADAFMGELFRAMEARRSGEKVQTREAKVLAQDEQAALEQERARAIADVAFENEERAAIAEAERLGSKAKIVDDFGRERGAIAKALEANPDDPRLLARMAIVLAKIGDPRAREELAAAKHFQEERYEPGWATKEITEAEKAVASMVERPLQRAKTIEEQFAEQGTDPNIPFATTTAAGETPSQQLSRVAPDGTVLINRSVLNDFLRSIDPSERADAIRALVHEEVVHSKVTNTEALDYWNALTAAEKALVRRRYGGPEKGRPAFTEEQLGHEALRARLQQLAGMTPREVFGQTRFERLTVKAILALERVIMGLRRALGTKASKFQTDMLDRIQRNLDAAKQTARLGADLDIPIGAQPPTATVRQLLEEGVSRPDAEALVSGRKSVKQVVDGAFAKSIRPSRLVGDEQGHAEAWMEGRDSAIRRLESILRGESPLAFYRRGGELPLEEGKLGERRATAADLGARRAPQLSPAVIADQFDRHWTQQGRPSFKSFTDELRKLEPDVQAGQLREAWTDAVWERLLKAPGAELERLRNVLGLEGKARKELQSRAPIPDPVSPEQAAREARGVDIRQEQQPLGFSLEREVPIKRGEKVLKTGIREYAIARIGEKLIGEAQEGRPALRRTELKPDDIGWWRQDDQRHPAGPAYRSISAEESRNVEQLGKILTQGAAVSRPTRRVDVVRGQPVVSRLKPTSPTVSKRVTAVLNTRTGTVDLLGTFDDHGAMIGDPLRAGRERPNVSLANLLGRKDASGRPLYRVLDSYLLDEPAQNFRQRFETFKEYRETFRDEIETIARERESGGPEYGTGVEIEGGETPRSMRVPTQPTEATGAIEAGGRITDAEAGAALDHLYDNIGGKLESVEDVKFALEDLADKPNWPVIALYEKWYNSIREANPKLSPEDALGKLVSDVYQTAQDAPNREAFVARALERNRPESAEPVRTVEAAPPETGARELEVKLEPARELRRYHGALAKQEPLNAPLAFWRGASAKGKHLAERSLAEPLRLYSEWMVDRLERAGGRLTKSFAQTARRIIDREKQLYGDLTPVLDPARREAGKLNKATTWFKAFAEKPTEHTAIRNAVPALEGTIRVPAYAQALRDLADTANRAIGQLYVGISSLAAAGGKFQRNLTGVGFDLIRRGQGEMWERFVRGNAVANAVPLADAKAFFQKMKAALDDPALDGSKLDTVNQDFKRIFPKAITDVKDEFGQWQPVIHSNLFDYLENAARRATHTRSFREVFPQTPAGRAQFQRVVELIRADTPAYVQPAFDGLVKALNGHPTDTYSTGGGFWGDAFRYLNSTLGNIAAKGVLTLQMATQLPETAVGATPQFLGTRRYLRAMAQARQVWTELERTGKRNAVMYDWSIDPTSPIRSASRIVGNVFSKVFAEQFLNEMQEGLAAVTAKILADDIRTGSLSSWDKRVLPESLKAMGFTESQAADMLANRAPHLVEQFERRAATFLTGGNKAIAEGSKLGANRFFNSVFRFQTYPMTRMNQLRKVTGGFMDAVKSGDGRRIVASGELLARFLFGSTLQGALTTAVVTLATQGLPGLKVKKEEAEDQWVKFLGESAISTMSGPLYLLFRGARDKGVQGMGEQLARSFFPYAMLRDLTDMTNGQGQYRDMDAWSRMGKFVQQKIPGTKPIRMALSAVGLAQTDLKTEAAIRGFKRWQMDQPGWTPPPDPGRDDPRGPFRTAMRKAATALQRGDRNGFKDALREAAGEATKLPGKDTPDERVAASLRARRVLKTPAGKYYFEDNGDPVDPLLLRRLESRIGRDAVNRLRYYDSMLEEAAEALSE